MAKGGIGVPMGQKMINPCAQMGGLREATHTFGLVWTSDKQWGVLIIWEAFSNIHMNVFWIEEQVSCIGRTIHDIETENEGVMSPKILWNISPQERIWNPFAKPAGNMNCPVYTSSLTNSCKPTVDPPSKSKCIPLPSHSHASELLESSGSSATIPKDW